MHSLDSGKVQVLSDLKNAAGLEITSAEPELIAQLLAELTTQERQDLALRLQRFLKTEKAMINEHLRSNAVKGIVALLPDSLANVRHLLTLREPEQIGEIHFTIFCFLDAIQRMPGWPGNASEFERILSEYLMKVRSSAGQAPWMAGDLLGDHWPVERAIPILIKAVTHGQYVAGREGAIHGLSHALDRADKRLQWRIVGVLREVARSDRSRLVRTYAKSTLGELRGL